MSDLRILRESVCRVGIVVFVTTAEEVERRYVCEDSGQEADEDGLDGKKVEDAQEVGVRDVCEEREAKHVDIW